MAFEMSFYTPEPLNENPLIEIQKAFEDINGRPNEIRTWWCLKRRLHYIFMNYYRRHDDQEFRKLYTSIGCIETDYLPSDIDSQTSLLERILYFKIDKHVFFLHV